MKITVKVTQEDIRDAARDIDSGSYCRNCPVARALRKVTGRDCTVALGILDLDGKRLTAPGEVDTFINQYDWWVMLPDRYRRPDPFSFEVEIPE